MHTIDECLRLRLARRLAYMRSHCAVSKQHELLNEFVSVLRFLEINAERLAVLVYLETHLDAVERYGASLVSCVTQFLGKLIQLQDFLLHVALTSFYHLLRLFVAETAVGLYDGATDVVMLHIGILVHDEHHGERQFLLVRTQGAKLV